VAPSRHKPTGRAPEFTNQVPTNAADWFGSRYTTVRRTPRVRRHASTRYSSARPGGFPNRQGIQRGSTPPWRKTLCTHTEPKAKSRDVGQWRVQARPENIVVSSEAPICQRTVGRRCGFSRPSPVFHPAVSVRPRSPDTVRGTRRTGSSLLGPAHSAVWHIKVLQNAVPIAYKPYAETRCSPPVASPRLNRRRRPQIRLPQRGRRQVEVAVTQTGRVQRDTRPP